MYVHKKNPYSLDPLEHENQFRYTIYFDSQKDSKTVIDMGERLESRFKIDRCIFVGERGMVSSENIVELRKNNMNISLLYENDG